MKKVISLLLTAMLLLSMLPATMAEGVEYIPAPYALDAERAGPKAYVEPVFYANGEGEPTIGVTYVGVIKADGKYFKDSNNNHELDPFEDWRLDPETRAADLVAKMSVEQKIGLSLAQMVLMPGATTYEAALDADGNVDFSKLMVVSEKVFDVAMDDPTRVNNSTAEIIAFNNRMGVVRVMSDVGAGVLYNNATNLTTEYAAAATGEPCIPFTLISNPQKFPGEPGTMGLAAAVMGDVANGGDYSLIERFADLDRQIWDAKGLDRMYGRQIDLITDPRWGRNVTTFTEDPAVMANITTALVKGYQGGTDGLQPNGVGLIVKHFPGDSASYNGFKSHYKTGQWRMYRTENAMEKYFLPGFQAAVDCKTAGIMSCYSRPMPINANQTYRGVDINSDSVATSYNATLLQTLLRDTMGFEGFVNTDSNILFDIPWGVEELTPLERIALMYNAGSDIIGDWWGKPIDYSLALEAYSKGMIQEEALTRATTKNVVSLLESDRFENPYEDLQTSLAAEAAYAPKVETLALEMSTKSLVLLKNHNNVLPLKETGKKVFVASFTRNGEDDNKLANWNRTLTEAGYVIVEKAGEADIVLLDVKPDFPANNGCMNTLDLVEDLEVAEYDTNTGMKTGGMTDLTTLMDVKKIKKYAKAVHANGGVVICSLTLSAPWILTKLEPYCDAILVNFASVTELAGLSELVTITDLQLQVLSGAIMPTGKLPVTLPSCTAVLEVTDTEIDGVVYELCASPNDVPGYDKDQYIAPEVLAQSPSGSYAYQDEDGNTYKVWFGLTY